MNITIYAIKDWEKDYLINKLSNHKLHIIEGVLTSETLLSEDTEVLCGFLSNKIDTTVMDKMPNLKLILTRSTGFDHIDLVTADARGVTVCNVPSYGENTVAEYAFALLLTLSRKMYSTVKRLKSENIYSFEGFTGFDLKDKTIGVVGAGRIGKYVCKIASGFGMNVLAVDHHVDSEMVEKFNVKYVSMEEVVKSSDVVSLHVPYTKDNHHLINKNVLSDMKKGAVLINTARGGLVDTIALLESLESGKLSGAVLDVLEDEAYMKGSLPVDQSIADAQRKLVSMDNVIVTPHSAFNTKEAIIRIMDQTVDNLNAYIEGKPVNVVKA